AGKYSRGASVTFKMIAEKTLLSQKHEIYGEFHCSLRISAFFIMRISEKSKKYHTFSEFP
ncbi:MAG: hypothetical protein LZF63_02285, partial [Nitrosomonas sp.]|nr:hypothetical protein [Nitrosomonas sp.]